ncbi:MAG: DEAD/DEAH box helicase family protein [Deltaproteobacteria bacterium]|nr:DEAD/DEAH box helicase family protein [Deltaproteobacteria bacterium]
MVKRVWERQGRVCALCRRAIPFDLMHGDHLVPWSQGGPTAYDNCQALCGSCNLRKGSKPQAVVVQWFRADTLAAGTGTLRRWQVEALAAIMPRLLEEAVLVEACPGAGKTQFALEVAYRLILNGEISRVLVIVPSLGIADGWLSAASATSPSSPTIPLVGPRTWSPVNPIPENWVGAVSTYQSLFAASDMFLAHASDPGHRTLVIFDEVHHAGAGSAWGVSAQEAFHRGARAILSLSGTPFRTQRDPIVFVPSEGGSAKPHYRYGYDQAIADKACRPVQFVIGRGETTFQSEDGESHRVTFDDELSDTGSRKRLRTALESVGRESIAHLLLADANQYLIDLRRSGDTDAAGLVVAVDCDHADAVATFMEAEVLPERPVVACSRTHNVADPAPADALKGFRHSHVPWIVAVNMVSEGIDIRRLRAVVYLTNRLTILSFRQIVGRVVRSDPKNRDDHGRVYLPADPGLLEMARSITAEVNLLPPPMTIEVEPPPPRPVRVSADDNRVGEFQALGSRGTDRHALDSSGRFADDPLLRLAQRYIDRKGLKGTDAVSLALLASENPAIRRALENEDE